MSKFTYGLMSVSAALVVGLPIVLSGAAVAQDPAVDALVKQLERMQRDINALSRQVYRGEGPPPSAAPGPAGRTPPPAGAGASTAYAARVQAKITQFEAELRDLTGQVEGFGNTLRRINERLDKLIGDVDFRLSSLEAARTAAPAGVAPGQAALQPQPAAPDAPPELGRVPQSAPVSAGAAQGGPITGSGAPQSLGTITGADLARIPRAPGSPAPASASAPAGTPASQAPPAQPAAVAPAPQQAAAPAGILPPGTPRARYRFASSLLRQGDYEKAAMAFEEFLGAHSSDKLASNARYWLGETHYVRGDYRTAANEFLTGYRKNPTGSKAPDSLLKLGMSLIGLNHNKDACATFDKLSAEFPELPGYIQKGLTRERARAECG
ncbi:MAG: tol-pal system protein YbgF [Rhodospirillales bacterium]|nr:tol-pal system protein YbgF [Rhodospirillales bacterium]